MINVFELSEKENLEVIITDDSVIISSSTTCYESSIEIDLATWYKINNMADKYFWDNRYE